MMMRIFTSWRVLAVLCLGLVNSFFTPVHADSAKVINARVNETLASFQAKVPGASSVLARAKGVLVMPNIVKAGFGIGGEYGEGALRINGQTTDYYKLVSASVGFQLGAQQQALVLAFMDPGALQKFRSGERWQVGADASVVLIKLGKEGSINSTDLDKPILAFVLNQKGLMYDLTLEGAKFIRVKK